jgi:hypothetical protein
MKKVVQYLFIIILFSFWGILLTNKEQFRGVIQDRLPAKVRTYAGINSPCAKPLEFSIGEIDPRFDISKADLLALSKEAESLWDQAAGKPMFQYDPEAAFKINLVYDDRQASIDEADQLGEQLKNLESSHENLEGQYGSLSLKYKQQLGEYYRAVANYRARLEKYNADVKYWNAKGGAQPDVYHDLKKEKIGLESDFKKLDKMRLDLNSLIGKTNDVASKDSQVVDSYNSNVKSYQNKYGDSREFEKGVYDGKAINIYQFNEAADLRLTLIHEMGHALGIDHQNDPRDIMYYLMKDQDMDNPKLTGNDIAALKSICKI